MKDFAEGVKMAVGDVFEEKALEQGNLTGQRLQEILEEQIGSRIFVQARLTKGCVFARPAARPR